MQCFKWYIPAWLKPLSSLKISETLNLFRQEPLMQAKQSRLGRQAKISVVSNSTQLTQVTDLSDSGSGNLLQSPAVTGWLKVLSQYQYFDYLQYWVLLKAKFKLVSPTTFCTQHYYRLFGAQNLSTMASANNKIAHTLCWINVSFIIIWMILTLF